VVINVIVTDQIVINVLMMCVPYAIVKKMMDKIIYLPILLVFLLGWHLAVTPSPGEGYWKSIGPSWDAFLNPVNQEELTK
jgi:hypothetical protein